MPQSFFMLLFSFLDIFSEPWTAAAIVNAIGPALFFGGITIGSSVGMNALSSLLSKKPKGPLDQGRNVTAKQAAAPRRMVYGKLGKAGGILTFIQLTGSKNEYLHMVITLAGHEVHGITQMYFDDETVPVDGNGDATGKYAGLVHREIKRGSTRSEDSVNAPHVASALSSQCLIGPYVK